MRTILSGDKLVVGFVSTVLQVNHLGMKRKIHDVISYKLIHGNTPEEVRQLEQL